MTTLNLTTGNPTLARLKAIRSPKTWANLPLSNLATADRENLLKVSDVIFNEELTDSHQVVSIQFDADKNFKRSYAPSLYQNPNSSGELCVKFGQEVFTFKPDFGGADVEVAMVALEKYEDPCLVITVEVADDVFIELPLPLRLNTEAFNEYREDGSFNITPMKAWVKKGQLDKLAALLMVAKTGGGASSGNDIVPLTDFPENETIKVLKAREVNASYGKSYILTASAGELEADVWAPYSVKEYLNLGAEVSDNTTMVYQNYTNRKQELRQSVIIENLSWPDDESSANIDMSIFA